MQPYRIVVLCSSIVGLAGLFLPWASILNLHGVDLLFSKHGDPTPMIVLPVLSGATLVCSLVGENSQVMSGITRLTAVLLASVQALTAADFYSKMNLIGSPGLYVIMLAGVVAAFAAALGSHFVWPLLVASLVIAGGAAGYVHVVRTDAGLQVCKRYSWGFENLFDDFVVDAKSYVAKPSSNGVSQALVTCGVLHLRQVETYGACSTAMDNGTCMDAGDCSTSIVKGLCPGASNIICCLR